MSVPIDNTCLENIIALSTNCGGVTPTSGLYSSDIGITENFLSQIVTSDYEGALDLFNQKKNLAIDMIANNIHTYFQDKYKAISVIDNFKSGIFLENQIQISPTNTYKGILFDLVSETSYLDFFVSSIELFTNYTGTIDVLVIDLLEGRLLETIPVNTVAGEIAIVYPNSTYSSKKRRLQLFFCYDTTGVTSFKTVLKKVACSTCTPPYRLRNSYENITSSSMSLASDFKRANISNSNDTGGLSVTHSLNCNHRDWLCSVSNQIAYPVLYKTAALLLEFALLESPNERYNTTDTNNADLLQKRLDAANINFAQSMDTLFSSMRLPQDQKCFECRQSNRHVIAIP